MRRVISYLSGTIFALTAAALMTAIVVLVAADRSVEPDHGHAPGLALIVLLNG